MISAHVQLYRVNHPWINSWKQTINKARLSKKLSLKKSNIKNNSRKQGNHPRPRLLCSRCRQTEKFVWRCKLELFCWVWKAAGAPSSWGLRRWRTTGTLPLWRLWATGRTWGTNPWWLGLQSNEPRVSVTRRALTGHSQKLKRTYCQCRKIKSCSRGPMTLLSSPWWTGVCLKQEMSNIMPLPSTYCPTACQKPP